jgi:hypothetical protein
MDMDLSNLDATFEEYLANITLTETQATRIDRALTAISTIFLTYFEGDVEIYVQGSFATGTTVKPLTADQTDNPGEFDVDIVLERAEWGDAQSALSEVEDVLRAFDKYSDKLSGQQKESCIRLEYAPDQDTGVGFHVDIVPIKNIDGKREVALRTPNSWKLSDSKALIAWTQEFQEQQPYLTATIMALKRMRDVKNLTVELPSIVILALLENAYRQTDSYFEDLLGVLDGINASFSGGLAELAVQNPVNHREDIIGKWRDDPAIFEKVRKFINDSRINLSSALQPISEDDIREVMSDDFTSAILLPSVDSFRSEQLVLESNGDLKRGAIAPSSSFGTKSRANLWTFFERSKPITFQAVGYRTGETLLWQVSNATGSESLRGDFFEARAQGRGPGTSANPAYNSENEQYPGTHWIRFIGYNASTRKVTTLGPKFYVSVRSGAGGNPFRR